MGATERNANHFMNGLGLFLVVLVFAKAASDLIMFWKTKTPSIVLAEWC